MKRLIISSLRYIPFIAVLAVFTVIVMRHGASAVDILTERFSARPWVTTAAFWGLYLLKSVSFGLPFALLYIGVGSIYPLGAALVINLIGIAVNMQIPYFVGRRSGEALVEKITKKFPRVRKLEEFSSQSACFFSFMVKFIGKIPHEITNALLGSLSVPYIPYMTGGLLGLMPTMVTTTLVGSSLREPGSPMFLISLGMVILLTAVSLILYRRKLHAA